MRNAEQVVRELQEECRLLQHFSLFEKPEYEFLTGIYNTVALAGRTLGREPWGKAEGQPGEWMSLVGLNADDFPPANEPVIAKLKRL